LGEWDLGRRYSTIFLRGVLIADSWHGATGAGGSEIERTFSMIRKGFVKLGSSISLARKSTQAQLGRLGRLVPGTGASYKAKREV